jgi:hypothetical protein
MDTASKIRARHGRLSPGRAAIDAFPPTPVSAGRLKGMVDAGYAQYSGKGAVRDHGNDGGKKDSPGRR